MVAYAVGYGVYALEKAFFTGTVGKATVRGQARVEPKTAQNKY